MLHSGQVKGERIMHEFGGKEARKAAQCSSRVEARVERLHLHPEAC